MVLDDIAHGQPETKSKQTNNNKNPPTTSTVLVSIYKVHTKKRIHCD